LSGVASRAVEVYDKLSLKILSSASKMTRCLYCGQALHTRRTTTGPFCSDWHRRMYFARSAPAAAATLARQIVPMMDNCRPPRSYPEDLWKTRMAPIPPRSNLYPAPEPDSKFANSATKSFVPPQDPKAFPGKMPIAKVQGEFP